MSRVYLFIDDITCSGGTERVAAFLTDGLVKAGHEISLISLYGKNGKAYFDINNKVEVKILGTSSFSALLLFLRKEKCDVMISISMGRLSFKLALLHKLLNLKSRLILSEHVAFESSSYPIRFLKLFSYQFADYLVLLTEHDYQILHNKVSANTVVIRNASSFSTLKPMDLALKQRVILAVGRLTYQKAFDRLLGIWASIRNYDGWQLRIIGDGEEKENLEKLILDLDLSSNVMLIPASRLIEHEYSRASIFAMTSRYEGLPLVLIESKSFGLPVIAFDCKTGPRELILHSDDGFLINDEDKDKFRTTLEKLMHDSELLTRMQLAALEQSKNYASDAIMKKWLELI